LNSVQTKQEVDKNLTKKTLKFVWCFYFVFCI